jgi:shikimate dehydrogenase
VLGSPIAHSLSPTLHRAAYVYLDLPWSYEAIEVTEPEFEGVVRGLGPQWRGLSLTMPLKRAAASLAEVAAPPVPAVGVANTLLLEDRLVAHNTDVSGMRAVLLEAGVRHVPRATVLGGGATAAAAVAALAGVADQTVVCVRDPERAAGLRGVAGRVGTPLTLSKWSGVAELLAAPLVVSTTPARATDELASLVPSTPGLLLDVLYDPWPTALARAWLTHGGRVIGGLALLVHQAVDQVRLMTGSVVPVEVLRAAVTLPEST